MRWRSALAFVGLLSFACAAAALLHRLGSAPWARIDWRHPAAWLRVTPPEDAVAALLRIVALALAYWLLASALLYAGARASRIPGAVRATGWLTMPVVRRLVDRAVAVAVVASAAAAPAARAAQGPSPTPPPVVIGVSGEVGGEGVLSPPSLEVPGPGPSPAGEGTEKGAPSPEERPAPGPSTPPELANPPSLATDAEEGRRSRDPGSTSAPESSAGSRSEGDAKGSTHHAVVVGDNLWDISAAYLARARGAAPAELTDADIHAYWVRVIRANAAGLRSGDPNLIYPGERIELPPVPDVGP